MFEETKQLISRRAFGLGALLIGTATVGAGELFPYHRRARVRCGLPTGYDYKAQNASAPDVRETSATLFLSQVIAPPDSSLTGLDEKRRLRVWQVVDRPLTVDHCSISNIAVWIDETGHWTVNLMAMQNPYITNGTDRQATPAARFLRNKFSVKLRAHGLAKTADPNRTAVVGQPEIFRIDLPQFWVERDTTIRHSMMGDLPPDQRARMPLVDRMEVEFRYE